MLPAGMNLTGSWFCVFRHYFLVVTVIVVFEEPM